VGATPAGRLLLFPQVFLAAVSLLDLPWVHVHAAALDLFSKVAPRCRGVLLWLQGVLPAFLPPRTHSNGHKQSVSGLLSP
jgi:hypothetical protein